MNRHEGHGPATRFGTSGDPEREDPRLRASQGRGDERFRDDPREQRAFGASHGGNWGGPTQGDSRGGYPSSGPRDVQQERFERYRDREGRFGTTYGMSEGSPRDEHRDFRRGPYDDAPLRDREPPSGYQENEGWGGARRGLSEGRETSGHEAYDPRYSGQDARRFGGEQRFGQGWESDQFRSRAHASNTYSPANHSGAFGGAGRGAWDRDDGFYDRHEPRPWAPPMGLGSFELGSGDVSGHRPDNGWMGRGPKGYQRSDTRIWEEICELLHRQGRIDASEVDVKVSGGEVTLTGTVGQRGDKLAIEHLVEHVAGVKDVRNDIRRATLTSGQSMHTGTLMGGADPVGSASGAAVSGAKPGDQGGKNPSSRQSS